MLEIYGADLSIPSNKVRYTANALDLDYQYHRVDLFQGEHKSPDHVSKHPAGKVPCISDDGFVLFESNAINKYFAAKMNSSLYPGEIRQRAIVDQWIDFASLHVGAAMLRVFFNKIVAPAAGMEVDPRSMQDGMTFLDGFLPIVEAQLRDNQHLASEALTLADITLLANLDPSEVSEVDLSGYPSLVNWRNRLKKQPFYTRCFNDYSDVVKALSAT